MDSKLLDRARLTVVLKLLQIFEIPKVKIRAWISRICGQKYPTLPHAITNATVRWLSKYLPIEQFRAITSGANVDPAAILTSCPLLLANGATIEEINTPHFQALFTPKLKGSTHILMHIHGGGFVSGSPEATSPYLLQLSTELYSRGLVADIFAVRYPLAPEAPFPNALRNVVAAYDYIITLGKPIILVGESAGGNLCLALLRHLHTPHPDIGGKAVDEPRHGRIVALHLSSPWVNLQNDSEAFRDKSGNDCLDSKALKHWRDAYLGSTAPDGYSSPMESFKGWLEALPPRTFLVTGQLDLFKPDILKFARTLEGEHGYQGLDVFVKPLKGHVWNLIDFGGSRVGLPAEHSVADEGCDASSAYEGVVSQSEWIVKNCT